MDSLDSHRAAVVWHRSGASRLLLVMYDAFIIILVSTLAAIITEAASWYLIYRTADYQRLKKSIEQLQAKGHPLHPTPSHPAPSPTTHTSVLTPTRRFPVQWIS